MSRGDSPGSLTSTFAKISEHAHWYHDVQCRILINDDTKNKILRNIKGVIPFVASRYWYYLSRESTAIDFSPFDTVGLSFRRCV